MGKQKSTDPDSKKGPRLVIITGPSGAGRSTAVKVLEDIGFETIDNLPLSLIDRLLARPPTERSLALGIDVRNRDFSVARFLEAVEQTTQPDFSPEVLYLDCRTDVLVRRFSETRRRHPMAGNESPLQGIEREIHLLAPIRARADFLVDTSELTPHELRTELEDWFGDTTSSALALSIQSFSYKRGIPRGLDMVFDCRFLRNPHWQENLRSLDGRSDPVSDFVSADDRYAEFFAKVSDLIELLLPAFVEEGKSHMSIGFGCTGGQHRSVTVTEKMANALAASDWQVSIRHRELEKRRAGANDSGNNDEDKA